MTVRHRRIDAPGLTVIRRVFAALLDRLFLTMAKLLCADSNVQLDCQVSNGSVHVNTGLASDALPELLLVPPTGELVREIVDGLFGDQFLKGPLVDVLVCIVLQFPNV